MLQFIFTRPQETCLINNYIIQSNLTRRAPEFEIPTKFAWTTFCFSMNFHGKTRQNTRNIRTSEIKNCGQCFLPNWHLLDSWTASLSPTSETIRRDSQPLYWTSRTSLMLYAGRSVVALALMIQEPLTEWTPPVEACNDVCAASFWLVNLSSRTVN